MLILTSRLIKICLRVQREAPSYLWLLLVLVSPAAPPHQVAPAADGCGPDDVLRLAVIRHVLTHTRLERISIRWSF